MCWKSTEYTSLKLDITFIFKLFISQDSTRFFQMAYLSKMRVEFGYASMECFKTTFMHCDRMTVESSCFVIYKQDMYHLLYCHKEIIITVIDVLTKSLTFSRRCQVTYHISYKLHLLYHRKEMYCLKSCMVHYVIITRN